MIGEASETILKNIRKNIMAKMGNALGTVVSHYNSTGKEFKKIDKDILRITRFAMIFFVCF